jgi:hypothetical protein
MSEETTEESVEQVAAPEGKENEQFPSVPVEPDPPSYAPIFTGLGIATFAWGFLTNLVILFTGLAIFIFGISIWIKELTK